LWRRFESFLQLFFGSSHAGARAGVAGLHAAAVFAALAQVQAMLFDAATSHACGLADCFL